MRRLWGVLISVALITATLQPVPAQEPIKIGVVGPHSGPAAYDGLSTLIGAQVAAEEINGAGGLLGGRKIEIVAADSRGIPAESVSAYRKVVTQDKVVAVDCCWFSSSTIATHPTIEELKIPTTTGVAFLPDAKETKLTYLFKFAQTPRLESRFVDYWVKKLNMKKVAFLARNDDWGRATSGVYQARLKELGGTVLSSDFYTPGEKDFYSYLTKVKALNPDGINVVDISATAATQVKQMAELGLTAKPLGSDGPITDAFIRIAGKAAEGVPLVVRYGTTLNTPRNKGFVSAFKSKRNGEEPDQYAQAGYDSIHLHAEAIKRAGSTEPEKLKAALARSDYVSVAGSPIRFDERQQATPKLYVAVVKDGKRVIVEEVDISGVPY
ncbi:MAG TPA: ABC transporter substrate-binding protein [Vicinamibacterales bacterium]|nr:ABC transporter substrate-binding protein [Vicinamibacterales bacterium]